MAYHIWEVVKQDECTRGFPPLITFILVPIKMLTKRCYAVAGWKQVDEEGRIRISTFYHAKGDQIIGLASMGIAFIISFFFAAIHLMAWYLQRVLLSRTESFLWLSFTGALFFLPVCAVLCALLHCAGVTPKYVSFPLLLGLYLFARVFLLVLAFAALRSLPHKALDKIQWPPFILIFIGN